ncbi:oxidoreductase, short-chain dehydrogenase/reductase family [Oceaniovalibus guishaninsula JLT2003]|uniref:Oxidoreductase, short-chain dehydrogenase/reductase family n=1 Tax=Oceaniovalibus guishaninsula JLT2003 TaxID=1231392 RepID=K2I857_9RHOB|nr:SDR family oxidoreductase [Oceaniovalibus guishaninsula]EKE45205.1 oxidoreductase, short-chain dehydrogenase/reductase family [Oceaniovalibus guishaninsula JLT2003]
MAGRSILITGCSSGIGYDAAHALHRRGWRVFAACRSAADCARLAGEGLHSVRLDYANHATIDAALGHVLTQTGGTLDALFNNGAFACPGAVEDLPVEALRAVFETNFFGWHALTRAVIPVMRAQGHGRIVNCSSVLGFVPMRWRGAYVASKYALEGLTDTLRLEMRDTPIRIVSLQPGPITTRIRQNSIPHFERWIDWRASPRRAQYESSLLARLYTDRDKPDRFELPPSAVTAALVHALESRRPRPRYRITTPTRFIAFWRRVLPASTLDRFLARAP